MSTHAQSISTAAGAAGSNAFVFQIYYDEASRARLDPGFAPLDNRANPRPDWYEFWVIRDWLRTHELLDGCWYGFLSSRFAHKTGIGSTALMQALASAGDSADVALFSPSWDQLAYFLNPFEQGEAWHAGLLQYAQRCVTALGLGIDLASLVTHAGNAVFSNYLVAKPRYWQRWLALADRYFELVESDLGLGRANAYGSAQRQVPMKVFVQERLPALLLANGELRVIAADNSNTAPLIQALFGADPRTRRLLQACDLMKREFCRTRAPAYLDMYRRLRATVPYTAPVY
jgi:hypothetical protein